MAKWSETPGELRQFLPNSLAELRMRTATGRPGRSTRTRPSWSVSRRTWTRPPRSWSPPSTPQPTWRRRTGLCSPSGLGPASSLTSPHSFSAWTPTELSHTEKWSAVTMISVPLNLNWCENLFSEQNFRDWVVSLLSPSWRTSTSRWSISQTRPGSRSWTTTSDALMRLVEAPVETTPVLEVCLVYIQTDLLA